MSKADAQAWAYSEINRLYPPVGPAKGATDTKLAPDGQIQGLAAIPDDWPTLPGSASLAHDLQWVQANRLQVVSVKPVLPAVVRWS